MLHRRHHPIRLLLLMFLRVHLRCLGLPFLLRQLECKDHRHQIRRWSGLKTRQDSRRLDRRQLR